MGGKHSKSINCLPSADVPGPGTYESRNSTLNAAPKYSMYGRTKMGTSLAVRQNGSHEKISLGLDDDVPGPGQYTQNYTLIHRSTGTVFSKDRRHTMAIKGMEHNPAPNKYDPTVCLRNLSKSPSCKFGSASNRPKTQVSIAPGPGQYSCKPLTGNEGSRVSIAGKVPPERPSYLYTPGPGSYSVQNLKETGPSVRMSTAGRPKVVERIAPAPGSYQPSYNMTDKGIAKWSFGTALNRS
jgi:hypothetical protein